MSTDAVQHQEFQRLLAVCAELGQMFEQGLVFIGGIAVYLHAINNTPAVRALAEATHYGDFYISLADMGDLRDIEEVTPNRRLSKSQLIKSGFEFDIYTERLADLCVPYDAVLAHSVRYGALRVAGLEHLFTLKLEAFRDRMGSAKGAKDARDLMRIAAVAAGSGVQLRPELIAPYLTDQHFSLFARLRKSPEAAALAAGNAVAAKKLRSNLDAVLSGIERQEGDGEDDAPPAPPRG